MEGDGGVEKSKQGKRRKFSSLSLTAKRGRKKGRGKSTEKVNWNGILAMNGGEGREERKRIEGRGII